MAYNESIVSISLKADSSIAVYTGVPGLPGSTDPNNGFQYRFVKITGASTAGLADTTAAEIPVGVLQNKPQVENAAATVAISGVSLVELGGTVAAGAGIRNNASGKGVTATAGTHNVLGVALQGGTTGKVVPVLLLGPSFV